MAITTITEAQAVFDLGHYLVGDTIDPGRARDALDVLLQAAGKKLMVNGNPVLARWQTDEAPVAARAEAGRSVSFTDAEKAELLSALAELHDGPAA